MTAWLNLADVLTFLGLAGAVLAVACAVVAAIAFMISGAPDAGAAAIAGWICCLILSLCSGLAGHWHLPGLAIVALPAALFVAGLVALARVVAGEVRRQRPEAPRLWQRHYEVDTGE